MQGSYVRRSIVLTLFVAFIFGGLIQVPAKAATDEQDVMTTMNALWTAYEKQDAATLKRIYSKDFIYGHSTGLIQNRDDALKALPTWEFQKLKSHQVKVFGSTAVVHTVMDLRTGPIGHPGTTQNVNVLYVLMKGNEGWQVIVRQATKTAKTIEPPAEK